MKTYFIVAIEADTAEDASDELAGRLEDARDSGLIQDFEIIEQSDVAPGRD